MTKNRLSGEAQATDPIMADSNVNNGIVNKLGDRIMGKIKVLILEDVPLDAELVEHELKRAGVDFESIIVEDEKDYLAGLEDFKPDIILADHSLPQFDGITALNLAKEHVPHTPFIFVSGKMGEEFAIETLKKGATDYVIKNNLSKLPHALNRALNDAKKREEKKKYEEALKKSEEKYRSLFEFSPDYILLLDTEGVIREINKAAETFVGYSRHELIGEHFRKVNNKIQVNNPDYKDMFHAATQGKGVKPFEIEVQKNDNTSYVDIRLVPLKREGSIFAIQIIGRDITVRKDAEKKVIRSKEELADLNNYLETIINSSPFAIFDLNPEGEVKSVWNPAAERIYGWQCEEVMGKLLPSAPSEGLEGRDIINKRVLSGEVINEIELKGVRKDGSLIDILMGAAPLYSSQGKIEGVMSASVDITAMVEAEKQIKASLKEKEVLLREVHHRVKNNLQIISSLMSLQSRYVKDETALKMFRESKNRVRAMSLIHEQLYQSPDLNRISFGDYIERIAQQLFRFYEVEGNGVELEIDVDELFLNLDTSIPLGLIVNELVSNSLKHAFTNGRNGKVSIQLQSQGEKNILTVSDDGIGLPSDFDIANTDSLGLHIVQTLTLQLRGTLDIKKSPGAQFKITFTG
ncbi:MAG: PAS domain S-box protein [Methanobacteriaceae archaeon]|nr:PAS domain S-box protein [Methanobacteriaceae archaeon]